MATPLYNTFYYDSTGIKRGKKKQVNASENIAGMNKSSSIYCRSSSGVMKLNNACRVNIARGGRAPMLTFFVGRPKTNVTR
jgi:hypothetical protein